MRIEPYIHCTGGELCEQCKKRLATLLVGDGHGVAVCAGCFVLKLADVRPAKAGVQT